MKHYDLPYFVEWGQHGWTSLLRRALDDHIGQDLTGKKVLEIGARHGKMSCLFALLGADVTAMDIQPSYLSAAEAEAEKWGVRGKVRFLYGREYTPEKLDPGSFDLVFTKSVLVLLPELEPFLRGIESVLAPGGKVVFLENAYGNPFIHYLRSIKHYRWRSFRKANYFTGRQIAIVREIFDITMPRKTMIPPVYLICGVKKGGV